MNWEVNYEGVRDPLKRRFITAPTVALAAIELRHLKSTGERIKGAWCRGQYYNLTDSGELIPDPPLK